MKCYKAEPHRHFCRGELKYDNKYKVYYVWKDSKIYDSKDGLYYDNFVLVNKDEIRFSDSEDYVHLRISSLICFLEI